MIYRVSICNENSVGSKGQGGNSRLFGFPEQVHSGPNARPLFKSSFYDSFGMLSDLSNYVLIVETIILILMAFVCEYRSRILIAVGAYFAWTSFIAPALGGSISPGVYYMFEALGFSVLVLLGLRSSGLAFLNALSGWFCF